MKNSSVFKAHLIGARFRRWRLKGEERGWDAARGPPRR